MQRGVDCDLLGGSAYGNLIGGDQAGGNRGLRLGTALEQAALDEQLIGASTSHAAVLATAQAVGQRTAQPRLRNICRGCSFVVRGSARCKLGRVGKIIISQRCEPMARKYSRSASKDVESAMRKRKKGTLKSGRSGKKVKSRKQAIAIGLSEARQKGKKVPKKKSSGRKRKSKRKSKRSS